MSTMRIMECRVGHVFLTPTEGPNQFQKPHEGCGAPIDRCTAEIKDLNEVYLCKICQAPEVANYMEPLKTEMRKTGLCFNCNFWQEKIQWRLDGKENAFVIKGNHCTVEPDEPVGDRRWSGCGGSRFHIRRLPVPAVILRLEKSSKDFKMDIITHNLWHQGTVPERFRDVLTDNAEFVTIKAYEKPGILD